MGKRRSPREQRASRERRGEKAFLFDQTLENCLGEFDRDDWEFALSFAGGDTARAARECGVADVPAGAKALWRRSSEEARSTYRHWQNRRKSKK
jgi:hypothetical protein